MKNTNHLIHETSPYLLQHAKNPVNWYPWGEEALNKAKKENKLLLISIGYSACHWCHVMEEESFENEEIAKIMNENYVSIKVDREERPDIDMIYMNAVQIITGNGGWPLNCFALPDGSPVYGGTYFKPDQWKYVLENLVMSYKTTPEKFNSAADDLKKGISQINEIIPIKEDSDFSFENVINSVIQLRKNFDHTNGGTWGAPKFPLPVSYLPLLRYYYHTGDKDVIKHVKLSLQKMAEGGIYDHLGGGFARYSVDKQWLVPHFEKMLYDNAQLVSLYADAYKLDQNQDYKNVIQETLGFVERDMLSPEGGFYSSYDADSDGEEGKFYVWQKEEVDHLLQEHSEIFTELYGISEKGNWEGKNILTISKNKKELADQYNISIDQLHSITEDSKKTLFDFREQRVKPSLDDKILTSWNALMLKAYVKAYSALHDTKYLEIAEHNFDFIEKNLIQKDFSLYRNYKNGKATIHAFLDDYALFIDALIELYQATFNEKYIDLAKNMSDFVIEHFYDSNSSMFYYTSSKEEQLIAKSVEINDNVIPSSNSVMAQNLFKLGHFFINKDYIQKAEQMLINVKGKMLKSPAFFGNWFDLMIQFIYKPYEVCILGKHVHKIREKFSSKYLPNILLAGGKSDKLPLLENRYATVKPTIYVCQNNVCQKPVGSVQEAFELINN
ncbi:MAG: thioredoxin domain-containing protein [Bacteroidetes bacterium]|nr:thioredoxin domain-containing protein [Bacteroidota bacterium]